MAPYEILNQILMPQPLLTSPPCLLCFHCTSALSYSWLANNLPISAKVTYAILLAGISVPNPTSFLEHNHIYVFSLVPVLMTPDFLSILSYTLIQYTIGNFILLLFESHTWDLLSLYIDFKFMDFGPGISLCLCIPLAE